MTGAQFLRVGTRKLPDLAPGASDTSQVLVGRHAITVDPSLAKAVTLNPAVVDLGAADPVVAPTTELAAAARRHVQNWARAVVAVGKDDPRCDSAGGQVMTVDGVGTPMGPACSYGYDITKDRLNYLKLDKTTLAVDAADDGTKLISVTFTPRDDTAAVSIKVFSEFTGGGARDTRAQQVTVHFDVDAHGNYTLSPKESIVASFW